MDVNSIVDLKEAVADIKFLENDLVQGNGYDGVKGFKRRTSINLVLESDSVYSNNNDEESFGS